MVEGTPLLRVQVRKGLEGSNPFLSASFPNIPKWLIFLVFRRVGFLL